MQACLLFDVKMLFLSFLFFSFLLMHQILREAALKDEICKEKNEIKNTETKVDSHCIDNITMCKLDQTIQTFLDEDKKKA